VTDTEPSSEVMKPFSLGLAGAGAKRLVRPFPPPAALLVGAVFCFAIGPGVADSLAAEKAGKDHMQLTSTAFTEGAAIPAKYTCDAKDISPPLKWSGVPAGAKSLALIVDDPDAPSGTWVHWVLYDLPSAASELPEALPKSQFVAGGAKQGLNDFRRLGYGGPCPPHRHGPHHYHFRLLALSTDRLATGKTPSCRDVAREARKHILAEATLVGVYER
jgi:Raf kinase inhibitor-like YbhB/YbcL family protein